MVRACLAFIQSNSEKVLCVRRITDMLNWGCGMVKRTLSYSALDQRSPPVKICHLLSILKMHELSSDLTIKIYAVSGHFPPTLINSNRSHSCPCISPTTETGEETGWTLDSSDNWVRTTSHNARIVGSGRISPASIRSIHCSGESHIPADWYMHSFQAQENQVGSGCDVTTRIAKRWSVMKRYSSNEYKRPS